MAAADAIRLFLAHLSSLFFPRLCLCCERGLPATDDTYVCFSCREALPYTNYHQLAETPVMDRLAGRVQLVFGTAYFFYRPDTRSQQIIHALKYYNRPEIGRDLGAAYGMELVDVPQWQDLDFIIPVPLHPKRLHQRGYNQAAEIVKGLTRQMRPKMLADGLERSYFEVSQTKKGRDERIKNVENVFVAGKHDLNGKHILLVDDVLTTGATLEACADALLSAYPSVRISLLVLGFVE